MDIWKDINTLDPRLQKEIIHNGADMKRFYTLSTEERQDVLNRIAGQNTSKNFWDILEK